MNVFLGELNTSSEFKDRLKDLAADFRERLWNLVDTLEFVTELVINATQPIFVMSRELFIFLILLSIGFIWLWRLWFYARELHRAKQGRVTIAPVSAKGEFVEHIGPHKLRLILLNQLHKIQNETQQELKSYNTTLASYNQEARELPVPISSERVNPFVGDTTNPYLESIQSIDHTMKTYPIEVQEKKVAEIEKALSHEIKDGSIKAYGFEIPLEAIISLFVRLRNKIPIFFRNKFFKYIIHVSLTSAEKDVQLIVYQGGKFHTNIRKVQNLNELDLVMRDAAFMILDLQGSAFKGQNWLGMEYLFEGYIAMDQYRRTCHQSFLTEAKLLFQYSAEADSKNHSAHYLYGSMLLAERTKESIGNAIRSFNQAKSTAQNNRSKALIYAGLANCFAQQYHRLAMKTEEVLKQAQAYANNASQEWAKGVQEDGGGEQQTSSALHPWILATCALVNHVDEGDDKNRATTIKRFFEVIPIYLNAISLEPENGMFQNNLGWVCLKLVEWGDKEIPSNIEIPENYGENLPELAENCFKMALDRNEYNKLTHANLALLYSSEYFRKKKDKGSRYFEACVYHGRRAIELDPNYISGHRDFAIGLLRWSTESDLDPNLQKAEQFGPYLQEALRLAKSQKNYDKIIEIRKDMERECTKLRLPQDFHLEPVQERTDSTLAKTYETLDSWDW